MMKSFFTGQNSYNMINLKSIKKVVTNFVSLIVIVISVLILVLISLISICINSLLYVFMITGLGFPMLANMIAGKFELSGRK